MITIFKSDKPNKKFKVDYKGHIIYFGSPDYEHYTEGHLDEDRKFRYLKRAMNITDGQGRRTKNNPESANFWSINFLWMKKTYEKARKYIESILGEKVLLVF